MKINFIGTDAPLEGYSHVINAFNRVLAPYLDPQAPVTVHHATPNRLVRSGKIAIASSMIEGDRLSARYVANINTFNGLLVPCPQNVQAMRDSGVTIPIKPVRHGTRILPLTNKRPGTRYVFGHLSKPAAHKNLPFLIEAFVNEFTPDEPVELHLKLRGDILPRFLVSDPRVKIIWRDFTEFELKDWYQGIDCFVFPSHAEGDGLPTKEAMSAGLPVILTNWGGLAQQADERYNFPLKIDGLIQQPDLPPWNGEGKWADPDFDELCRLMRFCYEHPEEARMRGQAAAKWMRSEWAWESVAPGFMQAVKEIVEGK